METRKIGMDIPLEMADFAANWWIERIKGDTKHDNGDKSMTGMIAGILGDMLNKPVTEEQLWKFKILLRTFIDVKSATILNTQFIELHCDYKPYPPLDKFAKTCAIPLENFPWKTTMMIYSNEIMVKEGYGANYKTIYKKNEIKEA